MAWSLSTNTLDYVVTSIAEFNGDMFASTGAIDFGRIYKHDGIVWSLEKDFFGTGVEWIHQLIEYGGDLFASSDMGRIYKRNNGAWDEVYNTGGWNDNMCVHNGELLVFANSGAPTFVDKYNGVSWDTHPSSPHPGDDHWQIISHGGRLWIGSSQGESDGEVWWWSGTAWVKYNNTGGFEGYIQKFIVFNNDLYLAAGRYGTPTSYKGLYKWNPVTAVWSPIIHTHGDTYFSGGAVFNDEMYLIETNEEPYPILDEIQVIRSDNPDSGTFYADFVIGAISITGLPLPIAASNDGKHLWTSLDTCKIWLKQSPLWYPVKWNLIEKLNKTPILEDVELTWTVLADFDGDVGNDDNGWGYSKTAVDMRHDGASESSLYLSPRKSMGFPTKSTLSSESHSKAAHTDIRIYIRNGDTQAADTDTTSKAVIHDTTQAEWEAGLVKTGIDTATTPGLIQASIAGGIIAEAFTGNDLFGVILLDGSVRIWGTTAYGAQAGGNKDTNIPGLTGQVKKLSMYDHVLSLMNDGTVRAWGRNDYNQCSNGTVSTAITGLSGITKVAAGMYHSAALKNNGTVWCWGHDGNGQIGGGGSSSVPVQIPGIWDAVDIAVGLHHTIIVRQSGAVRAWGWNIENQLYDSSVTKDMSRISDAVEAAGGAYTTYVRKSNGTVQEISDGGPIMYDVQTAMGLSRRKCIDRATQAEIADVAEVACGDDYTIARLINGTIRAWGGTSIDRGDCTKTTGDPNLINIVQIESYTAHTLARLANGQCKGWGATANGRLGGGSKTIPIPGLSNLTDIAAGNNHSLFCDNLGNVYACGSNVYGQCGGAVGSPDITAATIVSGISGVIKVSAGQHWSAACKSDGTIWVWGRDTDGQAGGGGNTATPTQIVGITDAVDVECLHATGFALTAGGTVRSWGSNANGLRGGGSPTTDIPGLDNAVEIAGGDSGTAAADGHVIVRRGDGTVRGWGQGKRGQCGGETLIGSPALNIPGLTGILSVDAGYFFTVCVTAANNTIGMGQNDGDCIGCSVAEPVYGLDNVVQMSGKHHAFACMRDNAGIRNWGSVSAGTELAILTDKANITVGRKDVQAGGTNMIHLGVDGNGYFTGPDVPNGTGGGRNTAMPTFTGGLWQNAVFASGVIDLGAGVTRIMDGIALIGYVPTGAEIKVGIRSGSQLAPGGIPSDDGTTESIWSTAQTVGSGDTGSRNVKFIQPVQTAAGRYYQYRLECNITGTVNWKVYDAIAMLQPAGWSRLVDITDSDTAVQDMLAKTFWQLVAVGGSNGTASWQVNHASVFGKHWKVDLLSPYYTIGTTNLKNLAIFSAAEIYGMGGSVEESAAPVLRDFSDLSTAAAVDLPAKTAAAADVFQARHLRFSVRTSQSVFLLSVFAKNDLNRVSPQLRISSDIGVELAIMGTGENKEYTDIFPTEIRGDNLPAPGAGNGFKLFFEASTMTLNQVKFKITGPAAAWVYVSLTNSYATAVLANVNYFTVGDIAEGEQVEVYFWMNAPAGVPLGSTGYQLHHLLFLSNEL